MGEYLVAPLNSSYLPFTNEKFSFQESLKPFTGLYNKTFYSSNQQRGKFVLSL